MTVLLHSIVFGTRCARVQAEFAAAERDGDERAEEGAR
jgi:hypothetical protein